MKIIKHSFLLLAGLIAALTLALPAEANEFVVYSCKTPGGAPAPVDGWQPTGSAGYGWFANRCAAGGSLAAGMSGPSQIASSSRLGWGFDSGLAPIRAYSIARDGRISGSGFGTTMVLFDSDAVNDAYTGQVIDHCAVYAGCAGLGGTLTRVASQLPEDSHAWFFTMFCGGYVGELCLHTDAEPDFGELHISSAAFTLEDSEQPSVGAVAGSLAAEGASFGSLTFAASDAISGIARATIEVDGNEVVSVIPNTNGGRCQRIGQAGAINDYLHRRPCPAHQQVELTLPRDTLTNGEHALRARAYDAAGNGVTAFGPKQVVVTSSAVTGLSAARFSINGPTSIVTDYGRSVWIRGTLLANGGEPIAAARVDAAFTSSAAKRSRIARTAHTDANGRFALTVKAAANRAWKLSNAATGARLSGKLKVRSRIALRATRRHVRPRGRMHLTGRILGERARRGSSVAIKVKNGRRWRAIAVVRTTHAGSFKFSYRFRRVRHGSLHFRAVALKSSDLTVSPYPSKSIRIRVG